MRLLESLPDFQEKSTVEILIRDFGHILLLSPKCHPEVAGCGIENIWAYIQSIYQTKINRNASNIEEQIADAAKQVSMSVVWNCGMATRNFISVYSRAARNQMMKLSIEMIQDMLKIEKTYRKHRDVKGLGDKKEKERKERKKWIGYLPLSKKN